MAADSALAGMTITFTPRVAAAVLFIVFAQAHTLLAQSSLAGETLRISRTTGSIKIDGDLSDEGWKGTVPVTTTHDIVQPAIEHDSILGGTALTPVTGPTLKRLGSAAPTTLALMHGPSYKGEARQALEALAAWFDHRLARATANR